MSTQVEVADEQKFTTSIQDLKSDTTDTNLVIVGHVNNDPGQIDVIHTGPDVSKMAEILDDTQVMYALARLSERYDMSDTVKFVYVHWMGKDVSFSKKGRFGVVSGAVEKILPSYHIYIETDSLSDLTTESMFNKIREMSGATSKVRETSDIQGIQERGFTQTQSRNTSGVIGKSSTSTKVAAVSSQGAHVTFLPEVSDLMKDVRLDGSPTNWALVGYQGGDPKLPVEVVGSGNGGLSEMKELLASNLVLYGLLRTSDEVDEIRTVKFVYITWVGSKVKPMTKGKVTTHKGACDKIFLPAHVCVFASEPAELMEEDIMSKVKSASGTKMNVKE